jgi:hypothetical protein
MLKALVRTITEILDSKKAAYSFIAVFATCVLHLHFGVSIENALLLVSPLGVATISQAHVDASAAKQPKAAVVTTPIEVATAPADVGLPAVGTDSATKADG